MNLFAVSVGTCSHRYTFQYNKQVKFLAGMAPKQAHSCAGATICGNEYHIARTHWTSFALYSLPLNCSHDQVDMVTSLQLK